MRRFLLVLALLSCHHQLLAQSTIHDRAPLAIDSVDQYILRNMFVGSLDSVSPIGARGNPIRGEKELWIVIPVVAPTHPENSAEVNAYFARALCIYQALYNGLNPEHESYDPDLEALYRDANAEAVARVPLSATIGELRNHVYDVFQAKGVFNILVSTADSRCERARTIPRTVRLSNEEYATRAGVTGRHSFSGPNEPCAIFRYCDTTQGPMLMYDFGSPEKQACFRVHEQLLRDNEEYRDAYESTMEQYARAVSDVSPSQALGFLEELYKGIRRSEYYHSLLAAYRAGNGE